MRILPYVAAAALLLLGAIWVLQGLNILPGSFMTGHIQWAIFGAMLMAVGIVVVLWARRRKV